MIYRSIACATLTYLALIFVFAMLPFVAHYIEVRFLVSPDWAARSHYWAIGVGILAALLVSSRTISLLSEEHDCGFLEGAIKFTGGWVLSMFLGYTSVSLGVPFVEAAFVGNKTEITFVVADADGKGGRKCRTPIDFENLPFMFDSYCFASESFRKTLAIGDAVVVSGHGTANAIFATSIRAVAD